MAPDAGLKGPGGPAPGWCAPGVEAGTADIGTGTAPGEDAPLNEAFSADAEADEALLAGLASCVVTGKSLYSCF